MEKKVTFPHDCKCERFLPVKMLGIMIDMRKGIPHHAFGWCDKTVFASLTSEQQADTLCALGELIERMQRAVKEGVTSDTIPVSATGQTHQTVEVNYLGSFIELQTGLEFLVKEKS